MVFEGAWDMQNCCDQSFQVGSNEYGEVRGLDRVVGGREGDAEKNFPQWIIVGQLQFPPCPRYSLFQMSHSTFSEVWPLSMSLYESLCSLSPLLLFVSSLSGFSGDLLISAFVHSWNVHVHVRLWQTHWCEWVRWRVSVDAAVLRSKRERYRMLR